MMIHLEILCIPSVVDPFPIVALAFGSSLDHVETASWEFGRIFWVWIWLHMLLDMGLCIYLFAWFFSSRWQWDDYEKGQETTCLQNQEVKASRASLSPQRMPCLIHVPRAWAKSAPSHDSDNIFEIINEVAACLGWNGSLRLLRFFWGGEGGGCLTSYKYVKAICWVVWVAQIAQELMEGKNCGEHTESQVKLDQSNLGQPVQELLSQNEHPHPRNTLKSSL